MPASMKQGATETRPSSVAKRIAVGLWLAMLVLAFGTIVFLVRGRSTPPPPGSFGFRGFGLVIGLPFGAVGAILAARRPRNPLGWVVLAMGLSAVVEELAQEYAIYAVLTKHGALPFGEVAAWVPSWIFILGIGGVPVLLLLFPSGHLPSARWRPVLALAFLAAAVGIVGNALTAGTLNNFTPVRNPFGLGSRETMLVVGRLGPVILLVTVLLGSISLVVRYRRASHEQRRQIKWLAYSGTLVAASLVPTFLWLVVTGSPAPPPVALVTVLAFVTIPVAIGVAVLKYRLYDIDLVIRKTLVYGSLTALLAGIYVGGVVGLGALLRAVTEQGSNALVIAASTLAVRLFSIRPATGSRVSSTVASIGRNTTPPGHWRRSARGLGKRSTWTHSPVSCSRW